MTPRDFLAVAVTPALSLLPERMDSAAARAMLVAIALQESDLVNRRQIKGAAKSYFQFEPPTRGHVAIRGVLGHKLTADLAREALLRLDCPTDIMAVHDVVEYSDVVACVFARLLLWTLPQRLPQPTETDMAWRQYIDAWRPGKPHPQRWPERYARAWMEVLA
jgi:hypothetical protein